jgi:manganese transport protein
MPHNLFLHSEVIQSRQINTQGKDHIQHALKFEFYDTLLAMTIGWAINSAMIILAADTFFAQGRIVESLPDAGSLLAPLLGNSATIVFGIALLLAGIASTVTSGMAAGSIFAGIYDEPYNANDIHSKAGILLSLGLAFVIILFIGDPFKGLIISQAVLSLQLPITMFLQVKLTSSREVMGDYANSRFTCILLYVMATFVSLLNVYLLWSLIKDIIG